MELCNFIIYYDCLPEEGVGAYMLNTCYFLCYLLFVNCIALRNMYYKKNSPSVAQSCLVH